SDPVPIGDQRTLFVLTARGERSIDEAKRNARAALDIRLYRAGEVSYYSPPEPTEILVLAAAGVGGDFEARLFDPSTPEALSKTVWGPLTEPSRDHRAPVWAQHHVGVRRTWEWPISPRYRSIEQGVAVTRTGVVAISRGYDLKEGGLRPGPLE